MTDEEKIQRFIRRMNGWSLNDDEAWVKVKLGEMRAIVKALIAAEDRN